MKKSPLSVILADGEAQDAHEDMLVDAANGVPTLEERSRIYLTLMHGEREFSAAECDKARDLVLTAMAEEILPPIEHPRPHGTLPIERGRHPVLNPDPTVSYLRAVEHALIIQDETEATPEIRDEYYEARIAAPLRSEAGARRLPAQRLDPTQADYAPVPMEATYAALRKSPAAPVRRKSSLRWRAVLSVGSIAVVVATVSTFVLLRELSLSERPFAVSQTRPVALNRTPPGKDEIANLLARSRTLIAEGNIAAARSVLERVAQQDAAAALELGATYDPFIVGQRVFHATKAGHAGGTADIDQARAWYEVARRLGSKEAAARLEKLAGRRL